MALYYDLPVYRDTYKLILKIFECTKDFSKEFKYTLGQDMKRDALQLVRSIYRANKAQSSRRPRQQYLTGCASHSSAEPAEVPLHPSASLRINQAVLVYSAS